MVLCDGGGRGRPRSDRRAGVDAVVGLLVDGSGRKNRASGRAYVGQKLRKGIMNALLSERGRPRPPPSNRTTLKHCRQEIYAVRNN